MAETAPDLLGGRSYVTDGGMETDLIFRRGVDLPDFAAFPLLDSATGRQLLTDLLRRLREHRVVGGIRAGARVTHLAGQPRLGSTARVRRSGSRPGQP